MFRNDQLRHLRSAQFFRYFYHHTDGSTSKPKKVPTDENTLNDADEGAIEDDVCHRNYDLLSSRVGVGEVVNCAAGLRVQVPWPSGDTIGISVLSAHRSWNHVAETETHSMSKDCCWDFRGTATKSRSQDHRTRATMLVGFYDSCSEHAGSIAEVQYDRTESGCRKHV